MDDTPPPLSPPSHLTNKHPTRAHVHPPQIHNLAISTSTSPISSSVYPTPPLTAIPTVDEHDRSPAPAPPATSSTHLHPLTTSEILTHLLPFLVPVPIPLRWDLGGDAALRDMFFRLFGDPDLFAFHDGVWSAGSGVDADGSFGEQGLGMSKGKRKERAMVGNVEKPGVGVGKVGVGDERVSDGVSQGEGENGDGDGEEERNERAERVEVDVSGEDVVMHDPSVPCSSSSWTTPKCNSDHASGSRGRSTTRKPRASNPDFSKEMKEKSTFSPVDWSKMEPPKTRVETSKAGARMLSLSPHARLILSPSVKTKSGSGGGEGASGSISPSTSMSVHAAMRTGTVSPANVLSKSRSSSLLSFKIQSPNAVSKSYTLPPQREGSIAALREVALGNVFPDEVVFGNSKNKRHTDEMEVDVDGGKEESESESGAGSCEEQERHSDRALGGEEAALVINKEKQNVADSEATSISAQAAQLVRQNGNLGSRNTEPVQTSLAEMGRTVSVMSSSSLSTLTSLPSSSSMSSRAESPEKPASFADPSQIGSMPVSRPSVSASTSSSASTVIDLKNIKFGPPMKKTLPTRLSLVPAKNSPSVASGPSRVSPPTTTSSKVSTSTSVQPTAPSPQTHFVLSQSSQTTAEEESVAQDLIMSMSSQDVEHESIDQFSSLVLSTPSKHGAGGYADDDDDDDISMGTSLGSRAVGVDSQSQIESANDATPGRRQTDQDEVEGDRPGSVPSSCSPPISKKADQQNVLQTPPPLPQHSSPNFTSPLHFDANESVPMEDANDDEPDLQSPEPPSKTQSKRADDIASSPSRPHFLLVRSLSPLSDIATPILQAKRELESPAPMSMEVGGTQQQQPSFSQHTNRRPSVPNGEKGKGKDGVRKSVPEEDVISISSGSEDEKPEMVRAKFTQKGKGKEKEKETVTPAASDPTPSQQTLRPKPVPIKRKAVARLNVFEKPPPEIVDLTTPVKEPSKATLAKGKGKANEEPILVSPSPIAASSSSVKRTRSSRMLVDGETPETPAVHPEPEAERELEQGRTRRLAPSKGKTVVTPLPVRKYVAKLVADAEESDGADIISVKKKKPAKKAGGDGTNVKRDPDEDSGSIPPEAGLGGGGKTRVMGILAGKSKQGGAVTRVKKRKRTLEAEGEDDNDDTVFIGTPPLKKAKARNGSTVSASASVVEKEKERGKSKPLSKVKTESVKGKEKEDPSENRYSFRSPRKDPSLGGISSASVSTPKKKKVVWPTVEKPNFDLFVRCDRCDKWYHIGCVGMEPEDIRLRETEIYCCPLCDVGLAKEESPVKNASSKASKDDNTDPRSRCSRRGCLRPAVKKHRGRKSQAEIQAMAELEGTFDVEAFVGRHKKVIGGQGITYEYLVKWLNYPYPEATWETISNMGLTNPATLLAQFEQATADEGIDLDDAPGDVVLLKVAAEAGWTEDRVFVKPETKA